MHNCIAINFKVVLYASMLVVTNISKLACVIIASASWIAVKYYGEESKQVSSLTLFLLYSEKII